MGYPAYPWWETGHRTVARIAAAHLTAAASARVAQILGVPNQPDAIADALAVASTWADETKAETKTGAWHYIDLTLEDHKSDIPARCQNDDCAPARISLFAAQLSSGAAAGNLSQLDALRYVVHFVGDIHQPLHTISNADLGGNCELLSPPLDTAKNLHALWDGTIVNAINRDDRSLAADLNAEAQSFSGHHLHKLSGGQVNGWVWESHELAERVIYHRLHIPVEPVEFPHSCQDAPPAITGFTLHIGDAYIDAMKPVVRTQVLKAGLRLAHLLNETFGTAAS